MVVGDDELVELAVHEEEESLRDLVLGAKHRLAIALGVVRLDDARLVTCALAFEANVGVADALVPVERLLPGELHLARVLAQLLVLGQGLHALGLDLLEHLRFGVTPLDVAEHAREIVFVPLLGERLGGHPEEQPEGQK